MAHLDEARYDALVAQAFRRILDAADRVDPDRLEADGTADMVTLTSSSGDKCVVNTQRAVRQIWVAGSGEGIHFTWDPEASAWRDDKGRGLELMGFVERVVEEMSGEKLDLG
jgi:CyaY protein